LWALLGFSAVRANDPVSFGVVVAVFTVAVLDSEYIRELRASPLPTTIKVRVALRPGDEGYDEAPVGFIELDDENPWRKKITPTT